MKKPIPAPLTPPAAPPLPPTDPVALAAAAAAAPEVEVEADDFSPTPAEEKPAPARGPHRRVEQWAVAKNLHASEFAALVRAESWPQNHILASSDFDAALAKIRQPVPEHGRLPVEAWAARKKTHAWVFPAAALMHRWPIGIEVNEADYDKGIKAAQTVVLR